VLAEQQSPALFHGRPSPDKQKTDAANPRKELIASAFSIAQISSNKKSRREKP